MTGLPASQINPVEVRFTYDLNGILEVETTVLANGKKQSVVITNSTGRHGRAAGSRAPTLCPAQASPARDACRHRSQPTARLRERIQEPGGFGNDPAGRRNRASSRDGGLEIHAILRAAQVLTFPGITEATIADVALCDVQRLGGTRPPPEAQKLTGEARCRKPSEAKASGGKQPRGPQAVNTARPRCSRGRCRSSPKRARRQSR